MINHRCTLRRLIWSLCLAFAAPVVAQQASGIPKVGVEDSPEAAKRVAAARKRLAQNEPEAAAKLVQEVFVLHGRDAEHHLLQREKGLYVEAHLLAAEMIAREGRLYEAYRQLYETEAAGALERAGLDPQRLGRVIDLYAMTPSGLKGSLRLAALQLESAEPGAAAQVLERCARHPALDSVRPLWLRLSATAARMNHRPKTFEAFRNRIKDPAERKTLEVFVDALQPVPRPRLLTGLDPLPAADASDVVSNDQWTVPGSQEARNQYGAARFLATHYKINARSRSAFEQRTNKGGYLNVMPLLAGDRLFINDGQSIWAV
ncbi:MAG: hypothetical protein R3236_10455, partial [Phycisphaeraceae bacterium]|nr:hypothetical protein [Phycisphaeraceae bacterium]